jgi:hypothetical protein
MNSINETGEAQQRSRWMRPDAARYLRPDMERYFTPGAWQATAFAQLAGATVERKEHVAEEERSVEDLRRERRWLAQQKLELLQLYDLHLRLKLKALLYSEKYSPNQPRVPKGNPDGGQWTSYGGGRRGGGYVHIANLRSGRGGINDPRVLSDVALVDSAELRSGTRLVQLRGRGPRSSGGTPLEFTPAQAARYDALRAQADAAIARVREFEMNWRPQPSFYQTTEGAIRALQGEISQAETRLREWADKGIGPGRFAGESLPARGRGRDFTDIERRELNRIISVTGCHTCGTRDPGTRLGNAVGDHQPPSGLNPSGAQRLFPQCASCSARQGGLVGGLRRRTGP